MLKPKFPGELMQRMHKGKSVFHRSHKSKSKGKKHHKDMSMKEFEGSPMDKAVDTAAMETMHKKRASKGKTHKHKLAHMKPKGVKGKAMVKKLGRTFKTGGFAKIAKKAGKTYGSKARGKEVAGMVFQRMARKHAAKMKK